MVWEVGKTFLIILGVVFRTLIFNPTAAESHPGNRKRTPFLLGPTKCQAACKSLLVCAPALFDLQE